MQQLSSHDHDHNDAQGDDAHAAHDHRSEPRPICPFCGTAWTDAMIDQLAAFTVAGGCACCGDAPAEEHVSLPMPTSDLCCDACGRAIYLKPVLSTD